MIFADIDYHSVVSLLNLLRLFRRLGITGRIILRVYRSSKYDEPTIYSVSYDGYDPSARGPTAEEMLDRIFSKF